jgi:hypothetical protein
MFASTNRARSRFNFGGIGILLEIQLVKPTMIFRSWTSH